MFSAVLMSLIARELPAGTINLAGGLTTNGKPAVIAWNESKATVLFFIATDCPIANRYAPEIARIDKAYKSKGVRSYRVYVSKKSGDIVHHGKEYKLTFPAVLDPNKKLVTATGVKVSPEVAVMNAKGVLVYRGRIDDQNVEHGVTRKDFRRDLRVALNETLAGKAVTMPEATAIGCYL